MKDNTTLSRDISFNQLMMIALGGTIGTGLFVGTGGNIASAGPLATLLAYLIGGIIVYSIYCFIFRGISERVSHYREFWGLCEPFY
ncbi:hypothetical protein UBN74_00980 [Helicobacter pylori]